MESPYVESQDSVQAGSSTHVVYFVTRFGKRFGNAKTSSFERGPWVDDKPANRLDLDHSGMKIGSGRAKSIRFASPFRSSPRIPEINLQRDVPPVDPPGGSSQNHGLFKGTIFI